MQINVVKNARRNMVFGAINKVIAILCPFITRTVILYVLGAEYLGFNSLFSSILQVLNLSELGIGAAIIYSMYKPVAENDTDTVCALLNFYRKVYAVIGTVILSFVISSGNLSPRFKVSIRSELLFKCFHVSAVDKCIQSDSCQK